MATIGTEGTRRRAHAFVTAMCLIVVLASAAGMPAKGSENDPGSIEAQQGSATTLESLVTERAQKLGYLDDGVLDPGEMIEGVSAAEYMDIAALGDTYGMTIASAMKRFDGAAEFQVLRDEIAERYPENYAASEWRPDGTGWIGIKGYAPQDLRKELVSRPKTVTFTENLAYNQEDLIDAASRLLSGIEHEQAAVVVDPLEGALDLYGPPETARALHEMRPSIAAGLSLRIHPVPYDPVGPDEDFLLRGRGLLDTGGLTSFTLKKIRGTGFRMGTCAHCLGWGSVPSTMYTLHSGDGGTSRRFTTKLTGSNLLDLGSLYRGTWTPTNLFYADWNTKRQAVRRSGLPERGDPVCHFRRKTPRSSNPRCSTVFNYYLAGSSPTSIRVIANHYISEAGDSGGPWYYSNSAIGVHRGRWLYTDVSYLSDFTPAYLYQNLNLDVWLG